MRTDTVRLVIKKLILPVRVGVYTHEKEHPQKVRFDLWIEFTRSPSLRGGGQGDRLETTLDYDIVLSLIKSAAEGEHIQLLETVADRLFEQLARLSSIWSIRVRLQKCDLYPFQMGIERRWMRGA